MGKTLLDLFNDPVSFRYGTDYSKVRNEKQTLVDTELSGLRVDAATSAVSLYGTQIVRITKQRTDLVESMKKETGGETDSGLINRTLGSLTDTGLGRTFTSARGFVEDKLGIPKTAIPTYVVQQGKEKGYFIESDSGVGADATGPGNEQDTMEHLAEIKGDASGTLVGKLLKQTGGGTPKQIINQAAGGAIKTGKKVVRGALFGRGTSLGANEPDSNSINQIYGSGDARYSKISEESLISYATTSKLTDGRVSDLDGNRSNWLDNQIIGNSFNMTRKNDRDVDYLTNADGYKYETNMKKVFEKGQIIKDENIDTVVVKIGDVRFHYAVISGITETFSPSWTGVKMVGSPFSAYMYDGIERQVSFNLQLYASNPLEHKQNWDNINQLSKLVYPLDYIGAPGAVRPPITNLTLGDMYHNKFGFISSLSHTVSDETTWELGRGKTEIREYEELFNKKHVQSVDVYSKLKDTDSIAYEAVQTLSEVVNYKLPKLIDVSITFTFIESRADAQQSIIYAFKPVT